MKYSTFLGVALMLGVSPTMLWAVDGASYTTTHNAHSDSAEHYATKKSEVVDHSDQMVPTGLLRASELMGYAIYNSEEEQIGSINDVVLDTESGEIKYIAMSTGGFLGFGDKLFAVPWKSFECKYKEGERCCTLDVDEETLEKAKGFDQDAWPNMADERWQQDNDKHYQAAQK